MQAIANVLPTFRPVVLSTNCSAPAESAAWEYHHRSLFGAEKSSAIRFSMEVGMEDAGYASDNTGAMTSDLITSLTDAVTTTSFSDSIASSALENSALAAASVDAEASLLSIQTWTHVTYVKVTDAEVTQQFFAVSSVKLLTRFGKSLFNFDYSASDLRATRALQYCAGVLFTLALLNACAGALQDRRDRLRLSRLSGVVAPAVPPAADDATYATLVMASLPPWVTGGSLRDAFEQALLSEHTLVYASWAGPFDPMRPRWARSFILLVNLFWILMFEAFATQLSVVNCSAYNTEESCETVISAFNEIFSFDDHAYQDCKWIATKSSCRGMSPWSDMYRPSIVGVTLLIMAMSQKMTIVLEWTCYEVILAKTWNQVDRTERGDRPTSVKITGTSIRDGPDAAEEKQPEEEQPNPPPSAMVANDTKTPPSDELRFGELAALDSPGSIAELMSTKQPVPAPGTTEFLRWEAILLRIVAETIKEQDCELRDAITQATNAAPPITNEKWSLASKELARQAAADLAKLKLMREQLRTQWALDKPESGKILTTVVKRLLCRTHALEAELALYNSVVHRQMKLLERARLERMTPAQRMICE